MIAIVLNLISFIIYTFFGFFFACIFHLLDLDFGWINYDILKFCSVFENFKKIMYCYLSVGLLWAKNKGIRPKKKGIFLLGFFGPKASYGLTFLFKPKLIKKKRTWLFLRSVFIFFCSVFFIMPRFFELN